MQVIMVVTPFPENPEINPSIFGEARSTISDNPLNAIELHHINRPLQK
jgi:hypothetical protein